MNFLITVPAYINSVILMLISAVHTYWGLGGTWGLRNAIPERAGTHAFQPGRGVTLLVAAVFGGMACFFLHKAGQLPAADPFVPGWVSHYGLWLLAGIFLFRAMGDFHYVGFTKKVNATRFAELDTRFYSPLCLLLGINTLLVIFLPNPQQHQLIRLCD